MGETFYRQLEVASCSQALVLMGEFKHPSVCQRADISLDDWERYLGTAGKKMSLLPSRRAGRRSQGPTGQSASPEFLGMQWNSNPGNHFQPREGDCDQR